MGVLQDRVAIVTGGSAGLGEATAELFAAEGALVIIAGASDLGEKVAERLGITFIKADVSRSTEVDTLVDRVAQLRPALPRYDLPRAHIDNGRARSFAMGLRLAASDVTRSDAERREPY